MAWKTRDVAEATRYAANTAADEAKVGWPRTAAGGIAPVCGLAELPPNAARKRSTGV